jgi:hypothetical protein
MPTKTKEQLAADIIAEHAKTKAPKASAAQKEQARKARAGARIANGSSGSKKSVTTPKATSAPTSSRIATADRSQLAGTGGVSFVAADYMTGDIWVPDSRIPAIDEATYEARKTQAEGQSRSIEVASLNLKNIAGLHRLEGQAIDIAIAAKSNQTRYAKLEGSEIDYQTQMQINGEKTQKLMQATAGHEMSQRETGYQRDLIGLKDQNFQLEIEQARTMFSEKSARYRAQISGQ